jgi:hypothetical protein
MAELDTFRGSPWESEPGYEAPADLGLRPASARRGIGRLRRPKGYPGYNTPLSLAELMTASA